MARFRLSGPARTDLEGILTASLERWGDDGRRRCTALLAAAMRSIAADRSRPSMRSRADLWPGLSSLHLRHVGGDHGVKAPVHVVYYRVVRADLVEIVRVLHERMDPGLHVAVEPSPGKRRSRRGDAER